MTQTIKKSTKNQGVLKVLVSTKETQGQRENDFCHVPEGELVKFGFICDRDRNDPDGFCGCARSLTGMECSRATTTVKVVSRKMTKEQFVNEYIKSDKKAWKIANDDKDWINDIKENADDILDIANHFPINSVLEIRYNDYIRRK